MAVAHSGAMPIELTAVGSVTPLATVNVTARVGGALDSVEFREGQMVRKGQRLARIDPRPFAVAVQQARGQLLRDQAALRNAQLDLARYRTLAAQDSIARQQVDTQAALVKQNEATVSSDQAAVTSAELNLSFTRIESPVAGRVGLRQIDPGNQIVAGAATPIAVVTQVDPISVVFSLPQSAIDLVAGAPGGGRGLAVSALDRTGQTVIARGALSTLDNVIDPSTGTVKARAVFANPSAALYPGQFVGVVLLAKVVENQVLAPGVAVRHGPRGDFVWVVSAGQVSMRPVTVGPASGETVSIARGLAPGETVVTEGGDRLRDGAQVTTATGSGAASGAPYPGRGRGHGHWRGGGGPPPSGGQE